MKTSHYNIFSGLGVMIVFLVVIVALLVAFNLIGEDISGTAKKNVTDVSVSGNISNHVNAGNAFTTNTVADKGTLVIPAGKTNIFVGFRQPIYPVPLVVASPNSFSDSYKVSRVTNTGFEFQLQQPPLTEPVRNFLK